jgi:hypothetical protein
MAISGTARELLQRLHALVASDAPPRHARLYGVGAPRTGTHSLAGLFGARVRARHEPAFRAAADAVLAHHAGRWSVDELRRFVRLRDERLRLDVDASHANAFLAAALVAELPDARFVLTMRDCFTWLESALDHALNTRSARRDDPYLAFWFGADRSAPTRHDAPLRELGLRGIDCHLAAWTRHNEHVLHAVPAERLLLVRTHELSRRAGDIADFAGIARARLRARLEVRGVARARLRVLERVDPGFVADRASAHCGALMARFFPEVRSLADAHALRHGR